MISKTATTMTEEIYYKYKEHLPPSGVDFEVVGHNYKGFLLTRDPTYLLWSVAYEDDTPPPLALRDRRYTDKMTVHEAVDKFLADEKRLQEASEGKDGGGATLK
jgi:hypothetical protein